MQTEKELDIQGKLLQAQRKAAYYEKLARDCGDRRLKESEDLSTLIAKLRATEKDLAQARDMLELRVQERTAELEHANMRLTEEMHERQQIAEELRQSNATLEEEQHNLEAKVHERTQEILHMQRERVRELATPLIPLLDHVILMPLIGSIDYERAQQVLETLLAGVDKHKATVAILDITGIRGIDTDTAHTLLHAARAVSLLGANVIITGIQPVIAQTIVYLGTDLNGIMTRSTLQECISEILHRHTGSGTLPVRRGVRARAA